jgi:glutathione S-transferase
VSIAFSPKGKLKADSFGTIAVGDSTVNLHDALKDGDGVIVVPESDAILRVILEEHPDFRRVSVPDDAEHLTDSLDALSATQVRDEAKKRGLKAVGSRDEILASIRTHDANQAGDKQSAELANTESKED